VSLFHPKKILQVPHHKHKPTNNPKHHQWFITQTLTFQCTTNHHHNINVTSTRHLQCHTRGQRMSNILIPFTVSEQITSTTFFRRNIGKSRLLYRPGPPCTRSSPHCLLHQHNMPINTTCQSMYQPNQQHFLTTYLKKISQNLNYTINTYQTV